MAKKIGLGMTYKDLLGAISSEGLVETTTNTYNGSINIKNGMPVTAGHTAVFTPPNEGDVWVLKKVVIKTVNSLTANGVAQDPSVHPLIVNIDNAETWRFSFASGLIALANIEYSVDLECTFAMPLDSHRETTRRLAERVSALEKGGGTGTGGSGLVIGETEGTAYDGAKGKQLEDTFTELLQEVVPQVNSALNDHETRITTLETNGGGGGSSSGGGIDETALATYLSENRYVQLEEPLTTIADYLSFYYGIEQGVVLITNDNLGSEVERVIFDLLPSVANQYGYCTEATAYSVALTAIDESETITDHETRITALENGGGGSGSSGGSESSGGTKLYKITGSAFESMTDNGLTFNFRAVVSKDPTLLTVFPELFDSFGAVSVMAMPDGSGFYPMGFVQQNGTWKVYGLKDGSVITSTYGIMFGSINTEEL